MTYSDIGKQDYVSAFSIYHNLTKKLRNIGYVFCYFNGESFSHFSSNIMHRDTAESRMDYGYTVDFLRNAGEAATGYGHYKFHHTSLDDNKSMSAAGRFVELVPGGCDSPSFNNYS